MPKKINYGAMFVTHDRNGNYVATVPTVWSQNQKKSGYFAASMHKNPKLFAQVWVGNFLRAYYGEVRADYIQSIPQFVKRMRFGCGVGIYEGEHVSRGVRRPKITLYWSELVKKPDGLFTTRRRQTNYIYREDNRIEQHHKASLKAAKIRAQTTYSILSDDVFNFEYDLEFIKDS